MFAVLSWWVILEAIGLLALPIALRVFRHLPERGYAFAKPLGLLLAGYLFWIGGSFGFLSNTRSGIVFALLLVGALSAYVWSRERQGVGEFLRENRRPILAVELVFLVAFVGWAVVRAYNPDIAATEKPMEIGFLNAILRSEHFPPHDPWLSGFAISYYYFGYLLIAMLTKLSGVPASVAFNLAIALLFALTAAGSFSIVYNLIATDVGKRVRERASALLWSLLGPVFVVLIGNLEGIFEVLHTRCLGSPALWAWLDVQGLLEAPVNGRWIPTDSWWWWRASRVVNDRDLYGNHMEVIDEFPQFSFLLGDMHPHVLNLPFVLLACALALNVLLGAREWNEALRVEGDAKSDATGLRLLVARGLHMLARLWRAHGFDLFVLCLCLGAMGFLNAWDLPIYLLVLVGAFLIGQRAHGSDDWLMGTVAFGASVAVPAALLYLPFYLGFQSQAGGVLPQLFNTTRVHQYVLMFGLFLFVLITWIGLRVRQAYESAHGEGRAGFWRGFFLDVGNWLLWMITGSILLMGLAVVTVMATSRGRQFLQGLLEDERVKALVGSGGGLGLLRQSLLLRLGNPWTFLLLAVLTAVLLWLIRQSWERQTPVEREPEPAALFVYWIVAVAFLLSLAVEFVYLRDLFGTRMNTVFKFYYQAWVLMAPAAAFGAYQLLARESGQPRAGRTAARLAWGVVFVGLAAVGFVYPGRGIPNGTGAYQVLARKPGQPRTRATVARLAWGVVFVALVAAGLVYPALGIPNKAGDFKAKPTLDGMAFVKTVRPEDYDAIVWLQANVPGIAYIVESTGGSYSDAAWVSAFTGLPTVLGWDFHEDQWRGNDVEPARRRPDIAQIYQSADSKQVLTLLDKYAIKYVYVGPTEKHKYELPPNVAERFGRFLEKVYEQGAVAIFRR